MKECPTCRSCFADDVVYCPDDGVATTPTVIDGPIVDSRYELEKRLGQGGMGIVFKARHIFLNTQHAIKVILPDLVGNDPMLVTRFRQEALAAAAIRHQNIIAVTDFGVVRGTMPFLVMEFVPGQSLQEIMAKEGAMTPWRAFELIEPICAGISAAHRQHIIHRDLKPLNVMVQDGVPVSEGVKILDFGLAKIKSSELLGSFVAAQTTGLMGSPFYMAPEQWSDEIPDARADVYSLGVILFQMLCGEVPFRGRSIPSIMNKHLTKEVPYLASRGVEVPPEVEAVVRHAMEKDRKNRTSSAEEFLNELHAAMISVSAIPTATDDSAEIDSSKAAISGQSSQQSTPVPKESPTAFGPPSGAISSAPPLEEKQKTLISQRELAWRAEAKRKLADEEEQKRIAQQELAREAEAKRKLADEEEQKRKEEEDERAAERRQLEELEAKQTKLLKEEFAQSAAGTPPTPTAVADPEQTILQRRGVSTLGDNSLRGASAHSFPQVSPLPAAKKSSMPLILALGVVLLLGAGVGGYLILRRMMVPKSEGPGTQNGTESTIIPDLVEITGGTFQMGRNDSLATEGPAHPVKVNTFSMDKTEVTNAEYAEFVREANHAPPQRWGSAKPPVGEEHLPVANVSYDDAVAFAEWRSRRDGVNYRLPTEEEWEYAARNGDKDNLYPWGNTWLSGRAATQDAGVGKEQAVGSYPQGDNRWGVQDLIGNVWEWTSSKATLYRGNPLKLPDEQKEWIVIRGGSYISEGKKVSGTMRDWFAPNYKNAVLGFRLVKPAS